MSSLPLNPIDGNSNGFFLQIGWANWMVILLWDRWSITMITYLVWMSQSRVFCNFLFDIDSSNLNFMHQALIKHKPLCSSTKFLVWLKQESSFCKSISLLVIVYHGPFCVMHQQHTHEMRYPIYFDNNRNSVQMMLQPINVFIENIVFHKNYYVLLLFNCLY